MQFKIIRVIFIVFTALCLTSCGNSAKIGQTMVAKSHQTQPSSSKQLTGSFTTGQIENYVSSLGYKQRTVEEDYLNRNKGGMIFMENDDSVTLFFQYAESSEDEKNPDMIIDIIKVRNTAELDLIKVNKNLLNSHSTWLKGYAAVPGLLKKAKSGDWLVENETGDQAPFLLTNLDQIQRQLEALK